MKKCTIVFTISLLLLTPVFANKTIGLKKDNNPIVTFENQMKEVWEFINETECLSDLARIELFKQQIIEPQIDKYAIFKQYLNDNSIQSYLSDLTERKAEVKNICLSPDTSKIKTIAQNFKDVYTDLEPKIKIYLMPSFGWLFKAQSLVVDGEIFIRLGLEELTKYDEKTFNSYIQHELFHVYHFQRNISFKNGAENFFKTNNPPLLYNLLWTEGFANYAVLNINPEYQHRDIVGMEELTKQTQLNLEYYLEILLEKLNTKDITGFFYFPDPQNPTIPVGCGYYLGMLIVEDVAERYNQHDLLFLEGEKLFKEIKTSILNLKE